MIRPTKDQLCDQIVIAANGLIRERALRLIAVDTLKQWLADYKPSLWQRFVRWVRAL